MKPKDIEIQACTHIGFVRNENQDTYLLMSKNHVWAVLDGIGGHTGGAVASKLAKHLIKFVVQNKIFPQTNFKLITKNEQTLLAATILANQGVHNYSVNRPSLKGMGTTLISCSIDDSGLFWTSVGDSRLYLLSGTKLRQLNIDHRLLTDPDVEVFNRFGPKNTVTRSIGTSNRVIIDYGRFEYKLGDIILLCSDGLSDVISDNQIKNLLVSSDTLAEAKENLLSHALEKGAPDNITFILIKPAQTSRSCKKIGRHTIVSNEMFSTNELLSIIQTANLDKVHSNKLKE